MNKDHDYSVFLAIIAMWMMFSGVAQCESAKNLDDIKHELRMLRYK